MPPKADTVADRPPSSGSAASGKLVIIGIVFVALWAAGLSWYFRYTATHRALSFWGPETVTLIRDAPVVKINRGANLQGLTPPAMEASGKADSIDVSRARGMVYLRNALLEDHNYDWASLDRGPSNPGSRWLLMFEDPKSGASTSITLTDDFEWVSADAHGWDGHSVSLDPVMTKGLREMFAEFTAEAKTAPANKEAASSEAPDAPSAASAPDSTPAAEPGR